MVQWKICFLEENCSLVYNQEATASWTTLPPMIKKLPWRKKPPWMELLCPSPDPGPCCGPYQQNGFLIFLSMIPVVLVTRHWAAAENPYTTATLANRNGRSEISISLLPPRTHGSTSGSSNPNHIWSLNYKKACQMEPLAFQFPQHREIS